MTQYLVYDVFTDKAFGGNQLAVFPEASELPEERLQKIAAEFNFSEVTFVYPPADPNHTAKVRIFTPTSEVDFAGHPTIGTIIALSDLGQTSPMVLELGVGPLTCTRTSEGAAFTTTVPLQKLGSPDVPLVASALSLSPQAIRIDTHPPIQASLGLPFVIAELDSRASLAACQPVTEAFREGVRRYPTSLDFAVFAYIREGHKITSRMFAPLDNITEDPATGSASATLAALLTEILGKPLSLSFSQGDDMGRPSRIHVSTQQNPFSVTITGNAVQTMAGRLIL